MRLYLTGLSLLALAACQQPSVDNSADGAVNASSEVMANSVEASANVTTPDAAPAVASLSTADGTARGEATALATANGLEVALNATGMAPGTYGVHIHSVGKCEGPKFESAGAHWNPTDKQHGADNPQGAHAGDLPNLTIAADGAGRVSFTVPDATLTGGAAPLLDGDGASFMIHAKPDDYRTDPSGASGDRIACGVFAAG